MAQLTPHTGRAVQERVPEWVYYMTDEQFFQWCKQKKVHIGLSVRSFPEDERAAIFRYMVRQHLVN